MVIIYSIVHQREYDYLEVMDTIKALSNEFYFLRTTELGKSIVGRSIPALQIGVSDEKILFAGGFHGCERLTTLLLLIFAERFCMALRDDGYFSSVSARTTLFGKSIVILPLINPDGYEIALKGASGALHMTEHVKRILGDSDIAQWNANARGVDINHNFDAGFPILRKMEEEEGITGPSPRCYGGEKPESEPETKILTELCRKENIRHALAFHSQGEEIFWKYGNRTPSKCFNMAKIFAASSGYQLKTPKGTASHGGFKDWFINEFAKPAFTFEIGKGTNPLDPMGLYDIYEKLEETFLLSLVL